MPICSKAGALIRRIQSAWSYKGFHPGQAGTAEAAHPILDRQLLPICIRIAIRLTERNGTKHSVIRLTRTGAPDQRADRKQTGRSAFEFTLQVGRGNLSGRKRAFDLLNAESELHQG